MLIPTPYLYHNYLRKDKVRAATEIGRYFPQKKNTAYKKNGKLVIIGSMNSATSCIWVQIKI